MCIRDSTLTSMSLKFLKLHYLISLVFDAFIQLVAKEKFAVNRRVCVSMEDLKFNKKTWSKGLDPSTVSVIVGQYRVWYSIHRIIVPVTTMIYLIECVLINSRNTFLG